MKFVRAASVVGSFVLIGAMLAGCGSSTGAIGSHHHGRKAVVSHPLQSVTVTASLQSFQILNNQSGWLLTQHALYHLTHGGRNATRVQASANGPLITIWSHGTVNAAMGLGPNPHDGAKIQSSTTAGATHHAPRRNGLSGNFFRVAGPEMPTRLRKTGQPRS